MILGLLNKLKGRTAETAILIVLGLYLGVFVYNKRMEDTNPTAQIGEPGRQAVMMDLREYEARSNKYTDEKAIATEKLLNAKHEEVLRSLAVVGSQLERLTESTRVLGQRIFELQRDFSNKKVRYGY